jgi:hypothetical protein
MDAALAEPAEVQQAAADVAEAVTVGVVTALAENAEEIELEQTIADPEPQLDDSTDQPTVVPLTAPPEPPSTACDGDAPHIPLVQEWRRLKREWAALDVQVRSAPLSGGANGASGGGGLALRKMARADVYKRWKACDHKCTELLLNPKCTARWPTVWAFT